MVVIKEPDANRRGGIWCDPCLVPLIRALNAGGIPTIASCCGHGHRPGTIYLTDGRQLVLLADDASIDAVSRLFPIDINGDKIRATEAGE